MNENYFRKLLEDYVTGQISERDQVEFFDLLQQEQYRKLLEQILHEEWHQNSYEEPANPRMGDLIEHYVLDRINVKKRAIVRPISFFRKYRVAAAAVVLFVIAGIFFILSRHTPVNENNVVSTSQQGKKADVPPGSNGAILTLDNGKQIILDSVKNGVIARQGSSHVIKQGQELSYQSSGKINEVTFNTITTPKGRQYPNLILADGTKVWLDAGSSIHFPVAFAGNERRVEITGQVWFDVVHNDKMPFKVMARGVEINDLGTEFNVNAYEDEAQIKITLIKGVIGIRSRILRPGQQARINENERMHLVDDVNIESVIAWKNGYFSFENADLATIMRQAARWYNVEVSYEGTVPQVQFSGAIGRDLTLSQFLRILDKTRIHYRIEGQKLIITP